MIMFNYFYINLKFIIVCVSW